MDKSISPLPLAAGDPDRVSQNDYAASLLGFAARAKRFISLYLKKDNISANFSRSVDAPQVRRVIFLQGPAGRTFEKIGRELTARGHGVLRVNFNFGDQIFWRLSGAVAFRSRFAAWSNFFENLVHRSRATDIVLFGDCRPHHRVAIEVARRNGVAVHVLEEGYIRPNWVTLERDGVNGFSKLPRDPDWYLRQPKADLSAAITEQPYSFTKRAIEDVVYNLGRIAGYLFYPFYRTHRPWNALVEYAGWIKRLLGEKAEHRRAATSIAALRLSKRSYFLFPLQLDCDFQVRVHSSFGALRPALEQVMSSFAQHAPQAAMLVIKQHPLENGLRDWRTTIDQIAARLQLRDRVVFLEAGDLCGLLQGAKGMVTINSTSGMDALSAQVPLIALGTAVYNIPGLTNGADLDRFWAHGQPAQAALLQAFRATLLRNCLIPGGFYSREGIQSIVAGVVRRLEVQGPPVQSGATKMTSMAIADTAGAEHAVVATVCA